MEEDHNQDQNNQYVGMNQLVSEETNTNKIL